MIRLVFTGILFIILMIFSENSVAQYPAPRDEPIVIQIIQLDHADAEQLAEVLKPFLSKDGTITPYGPANSLIIRDRRSIVRELVKVVKGRLPKEE